MELKKFFAISFLLGVLFYLSIALITDIIWMSNGAKFIYVIYFLLLHVGFILLTLVLYRTFNNLVSMGIRFIFIIIIAYLSARFLIGELMIYRPVAFGFSMVLFGLLGINFLYTFIVLVKSIIKIKERKPIKINAEKNNKRKIGIVITILWIFLLSWSYVGFSTQLTISDPYTDSNSSMRISFYGFPYGGYNPDYYNTSEWDQEAEYYIDMDSVFTVPWSREIFFDNKTEDLADRTATFHALEEKGLKFMLCLGPLHLPENRGDFFTYYYCEEMNNSIDLCVDWVEQENFTNFFGIQIDPEGPQYDIDNEGNPVIINASQHAFASISTQNKINEFKDAHPEWLFTTVSVTTAYFDWFDNDRDNDIMLKSISAEPLDVDYYGWQTYMVQQDRNGPNDFYEVLRMGKAHYGTKFSPWIGWYNGVNNYVEHPEYHENTLIQLKICKSLEVEEVFIAASYRYFPIYKADLSNFDLLLDLLRDLNKTRNEPFETFKVPQSQPHALYTNTTLWWDKITPFYFVPDGNVSLDLYCELQFEWLFWYQIIQGFALIVITRKVEPRK